MMMGFALVTNLLHEFVGVFGLTTRDEIARIGIVDEWRLGYVLIDVLLDVFTSTVGFALVNRHCVGR
jgi:hypothetical protein